MIILLLIPNSKIEIWIYRRLLKVLGKKILNLTSIIMFSWLILDRGILDRDLIPLDMSRKEANGAHGPDCSTETNGRPKAMATRMTTLQWQPDGRFCKSMRDPWTGWRGWRGVEVDGSNVAWLDPHKYLYMETSYVTRKIKPITHPYRSHMERYLWRDFDSPLTTI